MAKKNNSISPAAEELEQSVEQPEVNSGLNVYEVAWSQEGRHEARVYACSKLEAINRALNREGDREERSLNVNPTPFDLTCDLIEAASDAEASEYEDESEVTEDESEVAEDEKLYSVAWIEDYLFREKIVASTKIYAINEAMLIAKKPAYWARPHVIVCYEVGNEHNDDGFQDDGGYPDNYYTCNDFAAVD